MDLNVWSRCGTRRGTEFSRFLPLATDEGESQAVDGPCVYRIWINLWIKSPGLAGIHEVDTRNSQGSLKILVPDDFAFMRLFDYV
jgi:hypothetical protein